MISDKLLIPAGIQTNQVYKFSTEKGQEADLHIHKSEIDQLTYNLAVNLLAIRADKHPVWQLTFNENPLRYQSHDFVYIGTQNFTLTPLDQQTLEIEETDKKGTEKAWIQLSETSSQISFLKPPITDKIQELIAKAKIFQTADEKTITKILYAHQVGVILHAADLTNKAHDIYFANDPSQDFIKCASEMEDICKCHAADSTWKVLIPGDQKAHTLCFALGSQRFSHSFKTSWDNQELNEIKL